MKASKHQWFLMAAMGLTLAVTSQAMAKSRPKQTKIDRLINELLVARDDDDREDAAEDLGKVGGAKALKALDYAAANDPDRGVRREAEKAAERIRARLLANKLTGCRPRVVVVEQPVVARQTHVVVRPPVVILPHYRPARTIRVDCGHRRRGRIIRHGRGGRGGRGRFGGRSGFGLSFSLSF